MIWCSEASDTTEYPLGKVELKGRIYVVMVKECVINRSQSNSEGLFSLLKAEFSS